MNNTYITKNSPPPPNSLSHSKLCALGFVSLFFLLGNNANAQEVVPKMKLRPVTNLNNEFWGSVGPVWKSDKYKRIYERYSKPLIPKSDMSNMKVAFKVRRYSTNVLSGFKRPNPYSSLLYKMKLNTVDIYTDRYIPKQEEYVYTKVPGLIGYLRFWGHLTFNWDYLGLASILPNRVKISVSEHYVPYVNKLWEAYDKRFVEIEPVVNRRIPNGGFSYVYKTKWFKHRRRSGHLVGILIKDQLTGKEYYKVNTGKFITWGVSNARSRTPSFGFSLIDTGEGDLLKGKLSLPNRILVGDLKNITLGVDFNKKGSEAN